MRDEPIIDYMIDVFLDECGWQKARRVKMGADWSSRYYIRLTSGYEKAILLVSPPDDDPASVAGHKVGDVIRINGHLHRLGLSAPRIYGMDEGQGLVLMEDFGTTMLERVKGADQKDAYVAAAQVLKTFRDHPEALDIKLIDYYDGHVYKALRFMPEFYMPAVLGHTGDVAAYLSLWTDVLMNLPPCPTCFTHIDFFAENLMWLPERGGTDRVGILDYQGAVKGPFVYDLVNLLEDARRLVPDDVKAAARAACTDGLSPEDRELFDLWYPVMAAQFHARVLGQVFKLSAVNGRDDLMKHRTRLEGYLSRELASVPALSEIRRFLADSGVTFAKEILCKSA